MTQSRITELDYDSIKENLKTFLKSQSEFDSYNFEGSGLTVLMNLLAYNTHYNAYLANMVHNEAFLDSAVKRSSVVSRAKMLSYLPRSSRAAKAVVNIIASNPLGSPTFLTLDRNTKFTGSVNGTDFSFVNIEAVTITPLNNVYRFNNVTLVEGYPYTNTFTVVNPGPQEKYEIPNDNIDTTTIRVTVQNSSSDSTTTVYNLAEDITTIGAESAVYYIEENYKGKYEIFFGDGILGKKLSAGNIIRVEYVITNGSAANIASNINQTFSLSTSAPQLGVVSITTIQNSTGGAEPESINDIKFNAPRSFIAQGRAVTSNDYTSLLQSLGGNIESVTSWGGEESNPPQYGKVFISLKPYQGYQITNTQKETIKREILQKRNIVSIIPEFVDPDYIYVTLNTNVRYTTADTTKSSSQIEILVRDSIRQYFSQELQKFDRNLILSRLAAAIDAADPSIYGSSTTLKLQRRIVPIVSYVQSFQMNYNTKIHPGDVESTRFYVEVNGVPIVARITDEPDQMPPDYNGTGTLYLFNAETNAFIKNIGTVNYATGEMVINNIVVSGYFSDQTDIRISVKQQEDSRDIIINTNQILVLDDSTANKLISRDSGVTVNVIAM